MRYRVEVFTLSQPYDPSTRERLGQKAAGGFSIRGPWYADEAAARRDLHAATRASQAGLALHLPWIEAEAGTVISCDLVRTRGRRDGTL